MKNLFKKVQRSVSSYFSGTKYVLLCDDTIGSFWYFSIGKGWKLGKQFPIDELYSADLEISEVVFSFNSMSHWKPSFFDTNYLTYLMMLRDLRKTYKAVAFDSIDELYAFIKSVHEVCEACGGDGIETCDSPDHGFFDSRGCPCCGNDPNHKMSGKCEECHGQGMILKKEKLWE